MRTMEDQLHFKNYPSGRLVLSSPCTVGQEAFTPSGDRNKFCSQCNKVVYNLVGMNEAEIKALFAAQGGSLCGSMVIRRPRQTVATIRLPQPLPKPGYLKHLAATASLLLLTHYSQAAISKTKPGMETVLPADGDPTGTPLSRSAKPPGKNTMVTGVILNQDSTDMDVTLDISIFSKQKLVAKTTTRNGLFEIDLEGKVLPEDVVGLVIGANNARYADTDEKLKHHSAKRTMRLRDAQNIQLVVEFDVIHVEGHLGGAVMWEETIEPPREIFAPTTEPELEPEPIMGPVMPIFENDGDE